MADSVQVRGESDTAVASWANALAPKETLLQYQGEAQMAQKKMCAEIQR